MAKNKIADYDGVTAGNNTDIGGISIDEGMLPSTVNNSLRELTKQLGAFADGTDGIDVLNLHDDDASASIKIQAPATVTTTTTLTLPDGAGSSGQTLTTNGSGTLSWTTPTTYLANIVEDTTPQLGGDLSLNSNDITGTGNINITGTAIANTDTDTTNTGSVTLDFSANQNFVLTLTGNVTLANPTTEQVGQSGFIVFIQDATGGRTVSLGTDYETAGAAGLTLSSTASTTDVVPYVVAASGRILLGAPQLAFA